MIQGFDKLQVGRKTGCCLKAKNILVIEISFPRKAVLSVSIAPPTTLLAGAATAGDRADLVGVRGCGRSFRQSLIWETEEA